MPAALTRVAAERPQCILHCGDITDLATIASFAELAPIDAVAGNNDAPEVRARYGNRKIVEIAGVRLGLVHGDGVRGTTLGRARSAFAGDAVDAILFGHSHLPYCERLGGVWTVNPGSPTDKRREPLFSFAVIDITRGTLRPRLVFFE